MSKLISSGKCVYTCEHNKKKLDDSIVEKSTVDHKFDKYNTNEKQSVLLNLESINDNSNSVCNTRKRNSDSIENERAELYKKSFKTKCITENNETLSINNLHYNNFFGVTPDTLLGCYANLTKLGVRIDDYFVIISRINTNKRSHDKSNNLLDETYNLEKKNNRPKLYWAKHLATGFPVVIKVVRKTRIISSFPGSYSIWKKLCLRLLNLPYHPNVMRIYQVLEDDDNFYLVMEGLEGGELFQFLITEQAIPEETCKYIIRQILESVNHLHCLKMLHRDVKPENIMFRYKRREEKSCSPTSNSSTSTNESSVDNYSSEENNRKESGIAHLSLKSSREYFEVVLVDFDTCELIDDKPHIQMIRMKKRLVGTFGYLAPEVLNGGEYSAASDLWSIGIILYILMTGIPPLRIDLMCDYNKALEVLKLVSDQGGFQFDAPPLPEFPLAQDLCIRLLQWDPKKRIQSCQQALKHPWLIDSFKYNPIGPIYQHIFKNMNLKNELFQTKNDRKYDLELEDSEKQKT